MVDYSERQKTKTKLNNEPLETIDGCGKCDERTIDPCTNCPRLWELDHINETEREDIYVIKNPEHIIGRE